MRKLSAFFVFLLLLLLTLTGGQTAFAASTSASTASVKAPLDLAAMVLRPSDLQRPDAGIWRGAQFDDGGATQSSDTSPAGYQQTYVSTLAPPAAKPDYRVRTALEAFTDAKSAATGFTVAAKDRDLGPGAVPGTEVNSKNVGTRTIGAESMLVREDGPNPFGGRADEYGLVLVFRVDRVVATVDILDETGHKVHIAEAQALGDTLAARIERMLAGSPAKPGWSNRVLRLKEPPVDVVQDGYYLLDATDLSGASYANLPKGDPTLGQLYAGASDAYLLGEKASGPAQPTFDLRLAAFPARYPAAKWVKTYLATNAKGPDGWQHVKEIKDAKDFGDQSHTATFTLPAGQGAPGDTIYATVIVARWGDVAVSVRIEAYQPVPVKLVESLMAAQATCMTSTSSCAPIQEPDGLANLGASQT